MRIDVPSVILYELGRGKGTQKWTHTPGSYKRECDAGLERGNCEKQMNRGLIRKE